MLDRKLLDKHLILSEYLPSLLSSLVIIFLFLFLYFQQQKNIDIQHKQFLNSLFGNASTLNNDSFTRYSESLLLTGNYKSFTLLDQNRKILVHLGMPLTKSSLEKITVENTLKWKDENAHHFVLPSSTASNQDSETKYWVHFSTTENQVELWVYRSILLVLIISILSLATIYTCSKRFRNKLYDEEKTIEKALDDLSNENYGNQLEEKRSSIFSPLVRKINTLSLLLEESIKKMQHAIDQSVKDLEETLETVEIQNIEIDLARKSAIKANQAKSEFLASTSHEIRTPLNGILGFTNLMRKTKLSPQQEEYLETIEDSAQVLLLNINDIIDFSRLEIGKLNLEYKPIYIQPLIRESQKYIVTHTNLDDLELNTLEKTAIPTKLLGDPLRVKQVYTNLLSNALTICQSHKITTELDIQNRDDNQTALKVELVCHSEQVDIRELQLAQTLLRSSDPAHEKLTNKNHMGLVIAKGLVERMNGNLGLSTHENKTSFWFTVLLGKPTIDAARNESISNTSVLVVDDNPSNRRLICELLADLDVIVTSVGSGEEAIELCKKQSFSLVLMDIQMPGLNGFETTKIIRDNEENQQRTPIVALTAHAVEEAKAHLLLSGLDDFVSKPVGESELKELLTRWTQNHAIHNSSHAKHNSKVEQTRSDNQQTSNQQTSNQRSNNGGDSQSPIYSGKIVDINESLKLAKGKADLARDMLQMLLDNIRADLPTIKTAWKAKDYETLYELVHKIHGGACYSGVAELLSSSKLFDKSLNDEQYDRCAPLYEAFIYACDELLAWSEAHDLNVLFDINDSKQSMP